MPGLISERERGVLEEIISTGFMGDIDVIVPVTFLHFSQTEGAEGGRRRRMSRQLKAEG